MKVALVLAVAGLALCGCCWLNRAEPADPSLEVGYAWRVASDEQPRRLRVVTFNVYGASSRDIVRSFQRDPALRRADIIFFQEIETRDRDVLSRPAQVARALDMTYAYAPGYGLGERGSHGVAILSRVPLDDFRIIELPRVWVHINSARRVALGATARVGDRAVRLYNTHLDNRQNPGQRIGQIGPVFDDIERYLREVEDLPVVLGGDLNTSPFCWLTHLVPIPCGLQTDRLEAHARQRGMDTPVTASGATSEWLGMRLDGLYTRGLEVVDFDVARDVRVSDHLPLWMDIEF